MLRQLTLLTTLTLTFVRAADDCQPPPRGNTLPHPFDCCDLDGIIPGPIHSHNTTRKCSNWYVELHDPASREPPNPDWDPLSCLTECCFRECGLLTPTGELDRESISRVFYANVKADVNLEPLMLPVIEKCFSAQVVRVISSPGCPSGAFQLENCVIREIFLQCPDSLWNWSPECADLKSKIAKCSDFSMAY